MTDLLSLFRGGKRVGTTPKTTTPSSISPASESPERSGQPPAISAGAAYEVVVPIPSPVIPAPTGFYAPGTSGPGGYPWGGFPGADTTGWYFTEVTSTSPTAPPPPASPPATFFVLEATTSPKTTVDGTLPDRLYKAFTKGAR